MKNRTIYSLIALAAIALTTPESKADDHGDTLANATTITSPNTAGTLDTTSDADWFRLNVTTAGRHWIYTTGNTDTSATLYDDSGNYFAGGGNFDDDGKGRNFYFTLILQPGTYYLGLEDGGAGNLTGDYTLSVRAPQSATTFNTPNIAASLGVLGDLDHYRIHVQQAGRVWCFSTGGTDTTATLYDDSGNYVAGGGNFDDDGADRNFRFSLKLQPGIYYLIVGDGAAGVLTGNYTLSWRSPQTAQIFATANLDRSLGVLGDLDLYRVTISEAGPAWFYTTGGTDTLGALYDCAGNFAAGGGNFDDDGAGYNFRFSDTLAPDVYYLLVEHGSNGKLTGSYGLHLRDATRAIPLLDDGNYNHSLGVAGDLDLFVLSTSGGIVNFGSQGTTDTTATLIDTGGRFVAGGGNFRNDGPGNNFLFSANVAAGQYYLLVSGENQALDTGAYTLESTFTPANLTRLSATGTVIASENSSSISVSATGSWSVAGLPSWISASVSSGNGSGSVSLSYAQNLSGATREATITIGGQSYTVTQRAAGDQTGAAVPAQMTIAQGIVITVPTTAGVSYKVESSSDMQTWQDTGVVLQGDGTAQAVAFAQAEARRHFRAVPE